MAVLAVVQSLNQQLHTLRSLIRAHERIEVWPEAPVRGAAHEAMREQELAILDGMIGVTERLQTPDEVSTPVGQRPQPLRG